jgi:hypothetical protein
MSRWLRSQYKSCLREKVYCCIFDACRFVIIEEKFFCRVSSTSKDQFHQHLPKGIFLSGVNFINVKRAHFSYERLFSSYVLALNELSYEKFARLTLMKLTAGGGRSTVILKRGAAVQ